MPRKVSKLCAILAKIVTKFYNTAKKDVQWDFKLFNRVSCAVRILIENVLHPPILKAGICWQARNAGKPHHLWQKEVGLERKSWYMLKNLAKTFFYLRINFKISFPFSSYSFTNYSSNHRWLFCALLWIYYDVNLFMQFCSSKNNYVFNVSCPCLLIPFISKQNLSQHRKMLQARKKARNKVEAFV